MKTLYFLLIFFLCSTALSGQDLREKDPDADKFIGTWVYEKGEESFSLTLWKDVLKLGSFPMEITTGIWMVYNKFGKSEKKEKHAINSATRENPNRLEGFMYDDDYGMRYQFTLTIVDNADGEEAYWEIIEASKRLNPKEGSQLFSPPTTCIMRKVE